MAPDRNLARHVDLTSLQLFVSVCELGSIGRAAEREFIAASAVSKRMSDLEAIFRTPLLERHARGVTLTAAGESLLHHARALIYGLDKMQAELGEYAEGVRGHVRVHASISAIVQFLPEDLGSFARTHEHIKIDLEEHLSNEVARAVQEGAADLGICYLALEHQGLQTRPYRQDQLVLITPQQHPLAQQESIDYADALPYDQVGLHSNSSINRAMRQAALRAGQSIRLRIRVTGLDAMCRMIDNGLGVGIMPRRAFELLHGAGQLACIPLRDPWAQRQLQLVARDFSTLPQPARLLVEHLTTASPQRPAAA
ncbi:LysR family transcriptional regulator [Brachymonas sp. G13]|uniref:LysR family transcriptional regulator n=1 Tax=Brachymonas wangyanguii TaxID=3130163 RepID=UPI00307F3D08